MYITSYYKGDLYPNTPACRKIKRLLKHIINFYTTLSTVLTITAYFLALLTTYKIILKHNNAQEIYRADINY